LLTEEENDLVVDHGNWITSAKFSCYNDFGSFEIFGLDDLVE